MATTAQHVAGYQDRETFAPFYVLRISGLPYVWWCSVNPYASEWSGKGQWTLPTGMTAVGGLDLPDAPLEQALPDIIGGMASAERLRLRLVDFDVTDSGVSYKFFGRLFATGRPLALSTLELGYLDQDLAASATTGGFFYVRGPSTTDWPATGTLYVGSEAISYSAQADNDPDTGSSKFTIDERNRWPCTTSWPRPGYYRVETDENGKKETGKSALCATEPFTIEGRECALYVGHRTSGEAGIEAEEGACLRFVGRITAIDYRGGQFEIEMESVVKDIENAPIAPGLARARLRDVLVLPSSRPWRSFVIGVVKGTRADGSLTFLPDTIITIPSGIYSGPNWQDAVCWEVNYQLNAAGLTKHFIELQYNSFATGDLRFSFVGTTPYDATYNYTFWVKHAKTVASGESAPVAQSLLVALGFSPSAVEFKSAFHNDTADHQHELQYIIADAQAPSVVIPTQVDKSITFPVVGRTEDVARFFTNQGDGSARAWARFGDGQIVELRGADDSAMTLTTGGRANEQLLPRDQSPDAKPYNPAYIVPHGGEGLIEQILLQPGPGASPGLPATALLAQLLSSNNGASVASLLNVFPEGVGYAMDALVDTDTWLIGNIDKRLMVIDGSSRFEEFAKGILRTYGLFVVWDPAIGKIALRRMQVPTRGGVDSSRIGAANEDNRPDAQAQSSSRRDFSHVRVAWEFRWGWEAVRRKWLVPPIKWRDEWGRSAYKQAPTVEVIEDKSTQEIPAAAIGAIIGRSVYYRYPWIRMTRTMNVRGLLLCPGDVVQIIDATMHNPFTGLFGITDADGIYGMVTKVSSVLANGDVQVEIIVNQIDDPALFRPWSPTALVDRASGTNGYTAGSKTLYLTDHYTQQSAVGDGVDFVVGDVVTIEGRETDGLGVAIYSADDVIATAAADGFSCTLTTGISALPSTIETIMRLRLYSSQTTARKTTAATAVSFAGDTRDGLILATARNHRWQ